MGWVVAAVVEELAMAESCSNHVERLAGCVESLGDPVLDLVEGEGVVGLLVSLEVGNNAGWVELHFVVDDDLRDVLEEKLGSVVRRDVIPSQEDKSYCCV